MLFLAGADHGYCEIKKRTRQNNLPSATVSLQVVIGLCKRKEMAALKIKAAVSNGRVDRLLYDGFFSFAVAQQGELTIIYWQYKMKMLHKYPRQF